MVSKTCFICNTRKNIRYGIYLSNYNFVAVLYDDFESDMDNYAICNNCVKNKLDTLRLYFKFIGYDFKDRRIL